MKSNIDAVLKRIYQSKFSKNILLIVLGSKNRFFILIKTMKVSGHLDSTAFNPGPSPALSIHETLMKGFRWKKQKVNYLLSLSNLIEKYDEQFIFKFSAYRGITQVVHDDEFKK
ncbi:MAG: hypothetical protein WA160_06895 [Pseudobdellovibrio sp.]